jgi:hypothetical protein
LDAGSIVRPDGIENLFANFVGWPFICEKDEVISLTTCAYCGGRFFFRKPELSRRVRRARTYKEQPARPADGTVLGIDCLHCGKHQFIEVVYETASARG